MKRISLSASKTFTGQPSHLKRGLAFIIDILLVNTVILFPFSSIFNKLIPTTESFTNTLKILTESAQISSTINIVLFLSTLITLLYFGLLENRLHQTPGKVFFNLYVQSQNKELKTWQLVVRSMFLIPIFPFVLLWIIDPIVMFFTKQNQRLSEILSQTKVVEKFKLQ